MHLIAFKDDHDGKFCEKYFTQTKKKCGSGEELLGRKEETDFL
jgi:hypothetical protein